MKSSFARPLAALVLIVLLAACGHSRVVQREPGARPAGSRPAPTAPARPPRSEAGGYTVRGGDTLYGIAFRHGLDFREVAAWNRIAAPYTIYPGQSLRLRAPGSRVPTVVVAPPRPGSGGSVTGLPAPGAPRPTPAVAPAPGSGFVTVPPNGAPAAPLPVATPPPLITAGAPPLVAPPVPAAMPPPAGIVPGAVSASGWRWPTQGQLIGRFVAGDPKRQGLDIAGNAGQTVVAAADGVVVYSGAGLVGYGELIIVKHSDEWLSAYAHNRRRLVAEGTAVKGGQPIAELGRSGTSRDMLHFEVRRNGKPVDPLTVLPAP